MEVAVSVGWFPVHRVSECVIQLSGYLNIQGQDVAILILIRGELDAAMWPIEVFQK